MSPGPYVGLTGPLPRDPTTGAIQVSGYGVELGYAEITSGFTTSALGANGTADVPGLAATVTVGSRPIVVEAFIPSLSSTVASTSATDNKGQLRIYEGATLLQLAGDEMPIHAGSGRSFLTVVRLAPTAGAHTYKATVSTGLAATLTVTAAAGIPAFLRVVEV